MFFVFADVCFCADWLTLLAQPWIQIWCQHQAAGLRNTTCAPSSVHTAECDTNLTRLKKNNPMQFHLFHRGVNGRAECKATRGQASAPIQGNCVQLRRPWHAFRKVIRHRPWPFLNHPRETLEEEGYIFCPYLSGEFLEADFDLNNHTRSSSHLN